MVYLSCLRCLCVGLPEAYVTLSSCSCGFQGAVLVLRLGSRRGCGCGDLRWRLGALDDEPEHEGHLAEDGRLRVSKHLVIILRRQYACKAQEHPGGAGEGEPDAEKPRQESRPINKQGEGKEPQTPKYFVNNKSVKMQIEEQHSQSIALRLFEYGQEISPAHEDEGSDGVQLIQKGYRDLDDNQCHHERGVPPVDPVEQVVQSQGHEDKTSLADELARDAEAKERLVGCDVAGGRRCVSVDDELAGNIHHGEEARDGREDVEQARESAWVLGGTHVSSLAGV